MNRKKISMTALLAALLILPLSSPAEATAPRFTPKVMQSETLRIAAYHYPPLVDSQTPGEGLAAAIVHAALQEGGLPMELEIFPVKSLAKRSILYDGAPALLALPSLFSKKELARLSVLPCYSMRQAYYYYEPAHRELAAWNGELKGLKGYRLGVAKGEAPPKIQGVTVASDEPRALLRRLQEGELDVVLLPELVGRQLIGRYQGEERGKFRAVQGGADPLPLSLIVNPANPRGARLKGAYLKGLERIRKNGELEEIVARYQGNGAARSETYRAAAPRGVVEFGSSETPPFYSPALPGDGMAGEIVHTLFREVGLKSLIRYFPLKRLYTDRHNNHLGDPENFAGQHFGAIVPIALYRPAFFYYRPRHPKGLRLDSPHDLKGYRIGVLRGTVESRGYFERNEVAVTEVNSEQALFRLLKDGRIDLCFVIRETGEYTARKLFPAQAALFVPLEAPGAPGPITIMISADHPEGAQLGERVGEALSRIIKNGTYQRILEKYYGKGKVPADWLAELERYRVKYRQREGGRVSP